MASLGAHEIHFPDLALVLLERRDLLRVGRPHDDWPIALGPPGVVGRVSEILHAVSRQRGFPAGGGVADPEVPLADENGAFAVRRRHIISDRASSAAARRRVRRTSAAAAGGAGRHIARRLRRSDGIDDERFGALLGCDPIPEPPVGEPRRPDTRSQHQRRRVVGHVLFGTRIVSRRECARRSRLLR